VAGVCVKIRPQGVCSGTSFCSLLACPVALDLIFARFRRVGPSFIQPTSTVAFTSSIQLYGIVVSEALLSLFLHS
jgi:hypothetical protein